MPVIGDAEPGSGEAGPALVAPSAPFAC